ncbi:hypothetical protein RBH29_02620 [Herbivorax sp. ANBcel31]|uniref:hypothetical protein n=1 Tax=Herbivorax sp. ANBcel31 TaxID=3069754 RepID=UPI0027B17085|nr:hypothetical protein [Herbivorax sp. ANBcel31]MDQ2085331.1 hypothetical protein [Herbivorax sp. ANBcel31]
MDFENQNKNLDSKKSKDSNAKPLIIIFATSILSFVTAFFSSTDINGTEAYKAGYNIGTFLNPFVFGFIIMLISKTFVKKKKNRLFVFSIVSFLVAAANSMSALA